MWGMCASVVLKSQPNNRAVIVVSLDFIEEKCPYGVARGVLNTHNQNAPLRAVLSGDGAHWEPIKNPQPVGPDSLAYNM